jgi:hypothetical protein
MNTGILRVICVDMYRGELSRESMHVEYCEHSDSSDYMCDGGECYFNSQAYRDVVGKCAWNVLYRYFNDIADTVKVKLLEGFYIDSPEYYDFETDRLVFKVEIESSELKKIRSAVEGNKHFFKSIYERYRSRDGFTSHTPYTKKKYLNALSGDGPMLSKAVCMYLMYNYERDIVTFEIEKDVYQSELIAEVVKHGDWYNYYYDYKEVF